MLNKTKLESHNAVATDVLEKPVVMNLGSINQDAANAPQIDQAGSQQRRLRRESRMLRNSPSNLGMWRVSMW
jgi:hypothetical protein